MSFSEKKNFLVTKFYGRKNKSTWKMQKKMTLQFSMRHFAKIFMIKKNQIFVSCENNFLALANTPSFPIKFKWSVPKAETPDS